MQRRVGLRAVARMAMRVGGAIVLAAVLAGCVVEPIGPRYGYWHPRAAVVYR